MAALVKTQLAQLSDAERKALKSKPISELDDVEKNLRIKLLELELGEVSSQMNPQDLTGVEPKDFVRITVPLTPLGEMIMINERKYYGNCKVTRECAEQIMVLVSDSYKVERDRLTHRGNQDEVSQLRGQQHAQVTRFKEIMEA